MRPIFCIYVVAGGVVAAGGLALKPHSKADIPTVPCHSPMSVPVSEDLTECMVITLEAAPSKTSVSVQPQMSDSQKLIDGIRGLLQSGDASSWDHISQNELAQLIKLDPAAAANLAVSLSGGFVREQMLRQVAHGWAEADSTAALNWASNLKEAGDRTSSLMDVCLQMSQTDPAAAISAATQFELTQQPGLMQSLMQPWAAKDPAAALEWADQLPASTQRDQAMTRLAFVVAQTSPTEAADLVASEIPPGAEQNEAALSVLHQWALQDFAGAAAWAGQFDEGPFRERAEEELKGIGQKIQTEQN